MNRRSFLSSLLAAALAPAIRFFPAPAMPGPLDVDDRTEVFTDANREDVLEIIQNMYPLDSASAFLHSISTDWEKIYFYGRR